MKIGSINNTETGDMGELSIEVLFSTYYQRLCYFAFKMIDNKEVAEDVVQDSFVKFWSRQHDFTHELAAKTFLYTTVRNACLNIHRHEAVQEKFLAQQDRLLAEDPKGLSRLIEAEVVGEVHRAIEALPAGCRQVLKLAYFEKLKNEEIAGYLQVSVNTVKTQKARALRLLRMKMDVGAHILVAFLIHNS